MRSRPPRARANDEINRMKPDEFSEVSSVRAVLTREAGLRSGAIPELSYDGDCQSLAPMINVLRYAFQTPAVVGDYIAGPSHELPTGGSGASFSGLTADQFQRRTSIVEYDSAALRKAARGIQTLAHLETLQAHGQSLDIRFRNSTNPARSAPVYQLSLASGKLERTSTPVSIKHRI